MAKSKTKFDLKQVMIAKGEYIAMGVAGLFLAVLLVWGASKWAGAKNPEEMAKKLTTQAQAVHSNIQKPIQEGDPALDEIKSPAWVLVKPNLNPVPASEFPITGPQFDPIAKPDTKRENPKVLAIGKFQVDLIRAPMKGFDILPGSENESQIGVIVSKKDGEQDKEKAKALARTITKRGGTVNDARRNLGLGNPMPGGMQPPPGGMQPPPGGMQPPGGMGGEDPRGGRGGYNPYGSSVGGGYDSTAQRIEKAIEYVPLKELDKHMEKGKIPAMTVIPLRMVTIHAEIPYKKQVEEIKRALRLPTAEAAKAWGPLYDGYEVQRKVTRTLPGGKPDVIQDWAEYKFEDKYVELINSRKLADTVEEGYMSYFIRYDMALALPLPQLVPELGKYPKIGLENINATIKKLEAANRPRVEPSELLRRIGERPPRNQVYTPQSGSNTGASDIYGRDAVGGAYMERMPPGGMPMGMQPGPVQPGGAPGTGTPLRPGDAGNQAAAPPVEIDHLLLRFVDVDVEPGKTYEYRIRLRMLNPNEGLTKEVSNPAYAKVKELFSPWAEITDSITVPAESFLFAIDPAVYRKKVEEEYPKEKELRERLQARDNQAVVEMCTWMEQVKTGDGGKREPIGAWVVADVPVGRGEYVGRRQYVKLPLWSSEANQYVLRELDGRILPKGTGGKEVALPKGWLVDFTTKSVLVDFEGGKVTTKVSSGKSLTEEAATEMLIVRPDGKLVVKSSLDDEKDKDRKEIVADWEKWIKEVEKRKVAGGMGDDNPFNRPPAP